MGSESIIFLSGIFANILTKWIKPPKRSWFAQEDIDARKALVRLINLVLSAVGVVATTWLAGEPLDVTSLAGVLQSIFEILITFAFAQGTYHITTK